MLKNRVQLIGNLGQTPWIQNFDNGRKVARMNIAINENYKDTQGEYQSDTYWRTIVAWGKTAEIAERFLVKGSRSGHKWQTRYTDLYQCRGAKMLWDRGSSQFGGVTYLQSGIRGCSFALARVRQRQIKILNMPFSSHGSQTWIYAFLNRFV